MDLNKAIQTRLEEIIKEKNTNMTALSLSSNLTPSTVSDILLNKSMHPKIITIKKLCAGAGITLKDFFDREYFNDTDDVYE